MSKKLFCFDLDDTLVDEDYWFKDRWNKTFKLYSNIFKPNVVKDFFDIYDLHGPYYKFHLQDLSLVHNEISSIQEQIISTFKSIEVTENLFPGAYTALESLSLFPDYRIGIVSNGNFNIIINRLKSLNIINFVDIVICDSFMKKPNSKSFETISKNYQDHSLFFIGNDILLDIIPASENGFNVFLFMKNINIKNLNSDYNSFSDYSSFSNQFF